MKILGVIVTLSTSVTASVLIPMAVPVLIPTMLAGVSAINAGLAESFVIGVSSRKNKIFRERCELIQSYLNKMFVNIEKCKDDSIIHRGISTLIYTYILIPLWHHYYR